MYKTAQPSRTSSSLPSTEYDILPKSSCWTFSSELAAFFWFWTINDWYSLIWIFTIMRQSGRRPSGLSPDFYFKFPGPIWNMLARMSIAMKFEQCSVWLNGKMVPRHFRAFSTIMIMHPSVPGLTLMNYVLSRIFLEKSGSRFHRLRRSRGAV